MTILDANILLYAYNADAPQQPAAKRWLTALLAGPEVIGIPWVTAWAFLRISTNPRLYARPKSMSDAMSILRDWLSQPGVVKLDPGPRHLDILSGLVSSSGVTGPMLTDAVIAALAVENGAVVASADHDFSRFAGVRWVKPF